MRNMSFAMTQPQIIDYSKTVTRRDGWLNLKPGEVFQGVKKAMGLKKGEKMEKIHMLQCISNRRERLYKMIDDKEYGKAECILEGFPRYEPIDFVNMYVAAKRGRHAGDEVSRIEFRHLLKAGTTIYLPESVAVCVSCKGQLKVIPQEYKYLEDGTLVCEAFTCRCPSDGDYGSYREGVFKYLDDHFRFEA